MQDAPSAPPQTQPPEREGSAMTAAIFLIALNAVLIGSLGIRR